jgi:hypothetical protein
VTGIGLTMNPLIGSIIARFDIHPAFRRGVAIATDAKPIGAQAPKPIMEKHCNSNVSATGTRVANPRGMKTANKSRNWGRCWMVEYHGQNRATFECKAAGHRFNSTLFPKAPNGKIPAEALLIKFSRYWSKQTESNTGGVNMRCPKCWPH